VIDPEPWPTWKGGVAGVFCAIVLQAGQWFDFITGEGPKPTLGVIGGGIAFGILFVHFRNKRKAKRD
jgi:hypothetical protein